MKSIIYSIGWALLKRGLAWLIQSEILAKIYAGVVVMANSDLSSEEKHERVKFLARAEEVAVTKSDEPLPGSLLDIAIKAAYLEYVRE